MSDDDHIKVLVVDPDAKARDALLNVLADAKYEAVGVADSDEALACVETTDFRVVILELVLPKMSGMELAYLIRSDHPDTRVLVLSSIRDESTIRIVKQGGVFAYLTKPCTSDVLIDTVRRACNSDPAAADEAEKAGASDIPPEISWERPAEPRVLVLDDDRDARRLVSRVLSNRGFRVVEAETGEEALAKMDRGNFHVALLDIKMPEPDGLDVLAEIADRSPQTVPVMLTGTSDKDSVQAALAGGAVGYLIKPCRPSDLMGGVERALRHWGKRQQAGPKIAYSRGKSILVVDDDKHVREQVVRSLEREGYDAVVAVGGEDALFKLSQEKFAVVLLDVIMPGMDGVEVLKSIRATYPKTFVIMLTGLEPSDRDDAAILNQLMKEGAYDCLQKPCRVEKMVAKIDSVFREESEYWGGLSPIVKQVDRVSEEEAWAG